MTFEFIGALTLILGLSCLIWFERFKYDVLIGATLLGSSAAITFPGLAISIQPAHLLLALFSASLLASPSFLGRVFAALRFGGPGFWLAIALAYGAVGAIFFPRLFAGAIYVEPIGATAFGFSAVPVPLGPATGNLTQTVYFAGDLAVFAIAFAFAQDEAGPRSFLRAILIYAAGNILFAAADLATFWTGTGFLLDFIRNATYTLHADTVVYDLKRIVGSFTEASSFAYASIGALAVTLSLWLDEVRPRIAGPLMALTLILLILSTSTTAYVGLPILLGAMFLVALRDAIFDRVTSNKANFVIFAPLIALCAGLALMQAPAVLEGVMRYADTLVFSKSSSGSGLERAELNASAWANFIDSYGLGVGIGSARASSFVMATLANLGGLGALAYGAFLVRILFAPSLPTAAAEARACHVAARWGCFALLVSSSLSGTLIDLGLPFFILAGFVAAQDAQEARDCGAARVEASAYGAL